MRGRVPWVFGVVMFATALVGASSAQDRPVATDKSADGRDDAAGAVESVETPRPDVGLERFPVPRGTVFTRVEVGADGQAANVAGGDEVLIYDNPLGDVAVNIATNLVIDDIATVGAAGCRVIRYEFPVTGKVNPAGAGGPYTVNFALYSSCPGATPTVPQEIGGTRGQVIFPDDAPRTISFTLPESVGIQTNVWFGVQFSRSNAGLLVGAPASTGVSCDLFDFPGFPCGGGLGGFPDHPHASFNLKLFGTPECTDAFVGYKNSKPSGPPYNPGIDKFLIDDINLGVPNCQMIGYEVTIKGIGFYEFELRRNCDGGAIAGTERQASVSGVNYVIQARYSFDPPIALPEDIWFAAKVNNSSGNIILTGRQACVGETGDALFTQGPAGCTLVDLRDPTLHDAVNLTIICAGEPPVGACCDMYFPECTSGPDAGKICVDNSDCTAPGTCEAVCRQVPQMNCPFPPPSIPSYKPAWVPSAACTPNPFTPFACGKAACCKPNDSCEHLTFNECLAAPPVEAPRQWQIGRACNSQGQYCPLNACLGREGECVEGRPCSPCDNDECVGCERTLCCDLVCRLDPFCCHVCWDNDCATTATFECVELQPPNDVCAPDLALRLEGAKVIELNNLGIGSGSTAASGAATSLTDPGFGCYLNDPGAQGLQTVWYKFTPSAIHFSNDYTIQTCQSSSPAHDSLVAVYAVGDPTDAFTQCNSLIPIGCSDDKPGCGSQNKNAKVCLEDLTPGQTYYIQVASKEEETAAGTAYLVNINAGECPGPQNNDYCPHATCNPPNTYCITTGTTPFDFTPPPPGGEYWLDPPAELCVPTLTADMWFDHIATCTGELTVETCGANAQTSPDTNLVVYDGCDCPPDPTTLLACSSDAGGTCGNASRVKVDVIQGQCYKIRLGDSAQNLPDGNLKLGCVQADCPAGIFTFLDPPDGVVDAGRPHLPGNPSQLLGIQTITLEGTPSALPGCFTLCETAVTGAANSIASVVEGPAGTYTITLTRPITPGAKTVITYKDAHEVETKLHMVSHPANVNADSLASGPPANPSDVERLMAALNGTFILPFDNYSGDGNRSNLVTPADILEIVDMLKGYGYPPGWEGTQNQVNNPGCQ